MLGNSHSKSTSLQRSSTRCTQGLPLVPLLRKPSAQLQCNAEEAVLNSHRQDPHLGSAQTRGTFCLHFKSFPVSVDKGRKKKKKDYMDSWDIGVDIKDLTGLELLSL